MNVGAFGQCRQTDLIGTEWCGKGRAFGKSCRTDLIVLRISERLLPAMMEFQAAIQTFLEIRMASSATFVYVNPDKNRTVSVRRPIEIKN